MKIETGYLYHIKDEYFDVVDDDSLMRNHDRGKKRFTYFTIKDKNILWFIPISSKIEKNIVAIPLTLDDGLRLKNVKKIKEHIDKRMYVWYIHIVSSDVYNIVDKL